MKEEVHRLSAWPALSQEKNLSCGVYRLVVHAAHEIHFNFKASEYRIWNRKSSHEPVHASY